MLLFFVCQLSEGGLITIKIEGCSPDLVEYIADHISADNIEETSCYKLGNKSFCDITLSDSCYISYYEKFGLKIERFNHPGEFGVLIDSRRFGRLIIT